MEHITNGLTRGSQADRVLVKFRLLTLDICVDFPPHRAQWAQGIVHKDFFVDMGVLSDHVNEVVYDLLNSQGMRDLKTFLAYDLSVERAHCYRACAVQIWMTTVEKDLHHVGWSNAVGGILLDSDFRDIDLQ